MYVKLIHDMFNVEVIPLIFNKWRKIIEQKKQSPINRTPQRLQLIRKGTVSNFLNNFSIKPVMISGIACVNLNDIYYTMVGMYCKAFFNMSYQTFNSWCFQLYEKLNVAELMDFGIIYDRETCNLAFFKECFHINKVHSDTYVFVYFEDLNKAIHRLISRDLLKIVEYDDKFFYSVDREEIKCDLTNLFLSYLPTSLYR